MNLPQAFIARMQASLGESAFAAFTAALDSPAPVSIRLNKSKLKQSLRLRKIDWAEDAYFLDHRPLFAADPLWHAGAYYVQEASSMLLEQAFRAAQNRLSSPLKVLDLCAAPGGKSTHIASLLSEEDVLVSNEVIRGRVSVLSENIRKQGYSNVIVSSADAADFESLGEIFDLILVDAPCSGEGLFRKDQDAIQHWSPENLQTCELRQSRILGQIQHCLKPGGFLIYSTCTYNPGENEKQIEFLLSRGFELSPFPVLGKTYSSFQCLPHRFEGEGFFIALLQKTKAEPKPGGATRHHKALQPLQAQAEWKDLLGQETAWRGFQNKILAAPEATIRFFEESLTGLQVSHVGLEVGSINKNLFLPSETLPFALSFKPDAFPSIELSHEEALYYLAKNALPRAETGKGYVCLHFQSCPLGLGKFAGNRINNLFPSAWKLRQVPGAEQQFSIKTYF